MSLYLVSFNGAFHIMKIRNMSWKYNEKILNKLFCNLAYNTRICYNFQDFKQRNFQIGLNGFSVLGIRIRFLLLKFVFGY